MVSDSSLSAFIASNPDGRELKRALAVQMTLSGFKQGSIQALLGVQSSFISTWKKRYLAEGVDGLRLGYKGSQPRAIASKVPSGQYFSQVFVIPSGLEPFGLDADVGRLLLLEQTHGDLSQEGHIFRGMTGAYP